MTSNAGPLSNVRVLDLATFVAAPVTATLLGDFGADVVKIEQPGRGDPNRLRAAQPGKRSLMWLQEGRNRRSLAIDLRTAEGQQLVHRLVPKFDVVVCNFRPATLRRWRLDPDSLQAIHGDGILVYVTGYGLTGPYRDRGSLDRIASAFAGVTYASGEPSRPPVRAGYALIDYMAGNLAAFGAMVALYHRACNDGGGQVIDLGLFEAGFRASEEALIDYVVNGTIRERTGNRNTHIVPANDYDTRDGHRIAIHAGTDALFARLVADAMGQTELLDDPRFATYPARCEHQEALYELIASWVRSHDRDDVVEILVTNGIPASPLMNIADIAVDPHYAARGLIRRFQDDDFGEVALPAPLPHMSATPGAVHSLGPNLGADTDQILADDLGLTLDELDQLRASGVIG